MASDRVQFNRAQEKWLKLHEEGHYSVPGILGKVAIICSYVTEFEPLDKCEPVNLKDDEDIEEFKTEAIQIGSFFNMLGQKVELVLNAEARDFRAILQDPTINRIVTIGHGALSYLYMPNPTAKNKGGNRFDWRDAAEAADHLKLGIFTQRHCGNSVRKLSVPLGAFTVADQSQVVATANEAFNPRSLSDAAENAKLRSVVAQPLSYELVGKLFPKQK